MMLTKEQLLALGVALNGARLLALTIDPATRIATAQFRVCALPETGLPPADSQVQVRFYPVGQVAAVLKQGRWNDPCAPLEHFMFDQLDEVVRSFGGQPLSGWEFFDAP